MEDRGPGIAEVDLQNIFDRFHRADASRSRDTGGYGLGLAIVKAMVEAYGGTISAESSVGRGTKMSVQPSSSTPDRNPNFSFSSGSECNHLLFCLRPRSL